MKFKASDIQAIDAAIDQFKDMVEGGSEDERHQKYHDDLIDLLGRIKANENKVNLGAINIEEKLKEVARKHKWQVKFATTKIRVWIGFEDREGNHCEYDFKIENLEDELERNQDHIDKIINEIEHEFVCFIKRNNWLNK